MTTGIVDAVQVLVEDLVKKIVDKPSEVDVQVSSTTKSVLVQIKSAKEDIGKIIGKRGRTIDALKILTTVVKNTQFLGDKKDVFIEIIEDENSDFYNNKK
jgi:predicted RNA-binding protein YlqC (UPF0109 family)